MRREQIGPKLSQRIACVDFRLAHFSDDTSELFYFHAFELPNLLKQHIVSNSPHFFASFLFLRQAFYLLLQLSVVLLPLLVIFKQSFKCRQWQTDWTLNFFFQLLHHSLPLLKQPVDWFKQVLSWENCELHCFNVRNLAFDVVQHLDEWIANAKCVRLPHDISSQYVWL